MTLKNAQNAFLEQKNNYTLSSVLLFQRQSNIISILIYKYYKEIKLKTNLRNNYAWLLNFLTIIDIQVFKKKY